jgi:DNA-binding response OmpR family regulator
MLLDLMLPDAAGLDVLPEVRAADGATSRFEPDLPVIVLSGRGRPPQVAEGSTFEPIAYLNERQNAS